ncbi:diaminopimelate decarboxylase [Helicobacter bilis]|uniref:diaminopimelate decarboxylase n=1 Tax=Helicobacter bilis TaxID=37372 RepID=UPI000CF1068E|nr:diaminopimelate decarboxylase [Helicobacter bilis]
MKHFKAKCDYEKLAKEYGTPLYIYDIESLQQQYLKIKDSFGGFKSLVCYALKANSNLSILNTLAKLGSGADCVSLNEVKRAILAGIPPYKIIFSGVGKEDYEIEEAIKLGILFINVESKMELYRIEAITKKLYGDSIANKPSHTTETSQADSLPLTMPESMQYQTRISIRVNPDVDAKTHPYISTGLHENKFGLDIESAKELYIYAHKSEFLNPIGIHYHIGSQILDKAPLLESTQKILDLAKSLKALQIPLKFFDIGGGFGISYNNEESFVIQDYIHEIIRKIDALDFTAICEPGRFIMGNSGALLTRVIGEKQTANKRFVIVDCAMNDLLRPSLYHAYHHISHITQKEIDSTQICDVVGAICESGDYVGKDIKLPHCESGDLLLIESAGAYGYSMSSNYNSRMRPAEIAIYNGESYLIKEREEFDLSVQNELSCLEKLPSFDSKTN